jgi:hypothetical protein
VSATQKKRKTPNNPNPNNIRPSRVHFGIPFTNKNGKQRKILQVTNRPPWFTYETPPHPPNHAWHTTRPRQGKIYGNNPPVNPVKSAVNSVAAAQRQMRPNVLASVTKNEDAASESENHLLCERVKLLYEKAYYFYRRQFGDNMTEENYVSLYTSMRRAELDIIQMSPYKELLLRKPYFKENPDSLDKLLYAFDKLYAAYLVCNPKAGGTRSTKRRYKHTRKMRLPL